MDAEKLILAIRARPPLWDQRSKQYHNRDVTNKLWDEVAREMTFPKEMVKKKWKSLRDVFRGELKKIPKPKSGDETPATFTSPWSFFKNMLFLKDLMTPGKLTGNLPVPDLETNFQEDTEICPQTDTDSYHEEQIMDNDHSRQSSEYLDDGHDITMSLPTEVDTNSSNTVHSERRQFKPPPKRALKRKLDSDMDQFLNLEKEKLQLLKRRETNNDDDDFHFLMSFLPSMRKMTYPTKMLFRLQMQQLLYKSTVTEQLPYPEDQRYQQIMQPPLFSPAPSTSNSGDSDGYTMTTFH